MPMYKLIQLLVHYLQHLQIDNVLQVVYTYT